MIISRMDSYQRLEAVLCKQAFNPRSLLHNLKLRVGLADDVAPLFGKDVSNLAKSRGIANSAWGRDFPSFGTGKRHMRQELRDSGDKRYLINSLEDHSDTGAYHNLKDFGGVFVDALGVGGEASKVLNGIKRRGGRIIGEGLNPKETRMFNDKLLEGKLLQEAGGARVGDLLAYLQAAGISPTAQNVSTAQMRRLRKGISESFGPNFIIKPRVSNASKAESLITEATNPAQAAHRLGKGVTNLYGTELGTGGPGGWMLQERMNIKKAPWLDRVITSGADLIGNNLWGSTRKENFQLIKDVLRGRRLPGSTPSLLQEMRVHSAGGKVIPHASQWRGTWVSPVMDLIGHGPQRKAEAAAQAILDRMPANIRNKAYGFDMANTRGRGWVPLESNPAGGRNTGGSGFMNYGETLEDSIQAAVKGKLPAHEVLRRRLRAGTAVGVPAAASVPAAAAYNLWPSQDRATGSQPVL